MTRAGQPFRLKRQRAGETLRAPSYAACRACYKPTRDKSEFCSLECLRAYERLVGRAR